MHVIIRHNPLRSTMAVSLTFNRDFTRFVALPNFHHSVKVVTATEVLDCSGALLAQHSPVLMDMISKDSELFLDNYSDVGPCLAVLHGKSVPLSLENVLDLMKFSLQFEVREMFTQCYEWLKRSICTANFIKIFEICYKVCSFGKICGVESNTRLICCNFISMIGQSFLVEAIKAGTINDDLRYKLLDFC